MIVKQVAMFPALGVRTHPVFRGGRGGDTKKPSALADIYDFLLNGSLYLSDSMDCLCLAMSVIEKNQPG